MNDADIESAKAAGRPADSGATVDTYATDVRFLTRVIVCVISALLLALVGLLFIVVFHGPDSYSDKAKFAGPIAGLMGGFGTLLAACRFQKGKVSETVKDIVRYIVAGVVLVAVVIGAFMSIAIAQDDTSWNDIFRGGRPTTTEAPSTTR